jgi:acyl dehydratase
MTISTEIVGREFGPFVREYTFKDLEICALGSGAAFDGKTDLEYVNEVDPKNPQLKVLPIFGVPLTVHEEMTLTLDYGYNYAGSLHFGFEIQLHAPFKMNDRIETFVTQDALYDRGEGRGSLSKQTGRSYSSDGTHLCTVETWDVCIFDGGWGGEAPPKDIVEMPDREPDCVVEEVFPLNQPLIYRLMGDWHQQHIDWSYTEQTGLDRPIAHAISYAGLVMRHAISSFFPGEPERMTRFKTRVTSPLVPGTKLHTRLWKVGEGELRFALYDADADETGAKPHLNFGIIEYK